MSVTIVRCLNLHLSKILLLKVKKNTIKKSLNENLFYIIILNSVFINYCVLIYVYCLAS